MMQGNIQVVTIANRRPDADYYCFDEMKQSVWRHGCEPLILGWERHWGGLGSKPRLLLEAIEDGLITAPYILFMDAFDVVLLDSPEEILKKIDLGLTGHDNRVAELYWNAEKSCFPLGHLAEKFPQNHGPWKYLNSGFAVGSTEAMHKLLVHMKAKEIPNDHMGDDGRMVEPNDQAFFALAFVEEPQAVPMCLDVRCELCQTLHDTSMDELELLPDGKILNRVTGGHPSAFHWNGGSKDKGTMEPILKHLNLR